MAIYIRRITALLLGAMLMFGIIILQVNAEEEKGDARILNVHMEGEFEIYQVADLLDVLFGVVKISREPTFQEITRYYIPEKRVASIKSEEGVASCNFSAANLEDGVYLVVAAGGETDPFYACIPAPDLDGEGWLYTVDIHPVRKINAIALSGETEAEVSFVVEEQYPIQDIPLEGWQEDQSAVRKGFVTAAALLCAGVTLWASLKRKKIPKT